MKTVLVVTPLEEAQKELLQKAAGDADVTFLFRDPETVAEEDLAAAEILIGQPAPELLKKAANLSWMQLFTAGVDPYAGSEYLRAEAVLTNAASAHALSVSEHAVALTFALLRHLKQYAEQNAAGTWKMLDEVKSIEDSVIAVLGLGASGGLYAQKMKALGAHIIGVRKRALEKPDYVDEQVTMEHLSEVLPKVDIVTMVLPGGKETQHLMNEERLHQMKQGAYLINVGRGGAVDPDALLKVLREGHLGGAALDVTEPEPLPSDSLLWKEKRLFITPHVASNFLLPGTKDRAVKIAAENLRRYLNGEELTEIVDRKLGY